MKLERIHVDRFGAWNNLDLPVDPEGISVFYGPNEAGKTTLMRFVRNVLYGFPAEIDPESESFSPSDPDSWRGALQVHHDSASWIVERAASTGTRGLVTARNADPGLDSHPDGRSFVGELVDNVSENIFENIFAIGLYELQELATLESREVAEQIYSLSLGLDGQRLLEEIEELRQASRELLDLDRETGRICDLNKRLEDIDQELDAPTGVRRRHAQLCDVRERLEDDIVELKQRQEGLESQLHGHEYLHRVHAPWLNVRQLEKEMARFPDLPDFPQQGLQDLESIEDELAQIRGRRKTLREEAERLKNEAADLEFDASFIRYQPLIQGFIDQRDWIASLLETADVAQDEAKELRAELDERLERLGESWDIERLRLADVSHLAGDCLSIRAREFRDSSRRNRKLQQRYRRLNRKFHRRQEELEELRAKLGDIQITDAIEQTREELGQIEDLSRLRIRETELNQRRVGVANQIHRMTIDPALPQWVYATFTALGITGAVLGVIGVVMGLSTNGVGGFVYMLLGLVCGGVTFALKQHFEGQVEETMNGLRSELRELELRLVETRDAMNRVAPVVSRLQEHHATIEIANSQNAIAPPSALPGNDDVATSEDPSSSASAPVVAQVAGEIEPTPDNQGESLPTSPSAIPKLSSNELAKNATSVAGSRKPQRRISEADLVRQCLARLQSLEELARSERWVEKTRHELIDMRNRLRDHQTDFGSARQNWTRHLVDQGLDETIDVYQALEQQDAVARAGILLNRIGSIEDDAHVARHLYEQIRKRIEELGHRLDDFESDYSKPVEVLDSWAETLAESSDARDQQKALRKRARQCRREIRKFSGRVRQLNGKRAAILVRGGAVSREEFAERAEQLEERFALQEKLDRARDELSVAASGDRAMAVVESDLEAFDEKQNSHCIVTIRQELQDMELDVEAAYEKLGRLKQEIEALENDRSVAELRFDREQLLAEMTELAEEWFAIQWSLENLDELRGEFEKNHQPPILARAKDYLQQLSGGRYHNIWTPLGQRTLCVDDRDNNTMVVENLSGGTREQLFLAIRFALIEHYQSEGVELPIILDDVLVNFDQERTQAAVDLLVEKTSNDQQILFFTCHQHLADMFRSRGVSTVNLPTRSTGRSDVSDELMAG